MALLGALVFLLSLILGGRFAWLIYTLSGVLETPVVP